MNKRIKELKEEGEGEESKFDLPKIIEVTRDHQAWKDFDFTEYTGLRLKRQTDSLSYDAYVNMDNLYLKREIEYNRATPKSVLEHEFKIGLVLCSMCMLYSEESRNKTKTSESDEGTVQDPLNMVNAACDGLSLVILPLVNILKDMSKKFAIEQ